MNKKTRPPEEQARQEKIKTLLQESNVTSMEYTSRICSRKPLLN